MCLTVWCCWLWGIGSQNQSQRKNHVLSKLSRNYKKPLPEQHVDKHGFLATENLLDIHLSMSQQDWMTCQCSHQFLAWMLYRFLTRRPPTAHSAQPQITYQTSPKSNFWYFFFATKSMAVIVFCMAQFILRSHTKETILNLIDRFHQHKHSFHRNKVIRLFIYGMVRICQNFGHLKRTTK